MGLVEVLEVIFEADESVWVGFEGEGGESIQEEEIGPITDESTDIIGDGGMGSFEDRFVFGLPAQAIIEEEGFLFDNFGCDNGILFQGPDTASKFGWGHHRVTHLGEADWGSGQRVSRTLFWGLTFQITFKGRVPSQCSLWGGPPPYSL
jgi:hypothetical protein